jgi:hypothetical protein
MTMSDQVRADDVLESAVLGGVIDLDAVASFADLLAEEDFANINHGAIWTASQPTPASLSGPASMMKTKRLSMPSLHPVVATIALQTSNSIGPKVVPSAA